MRCGHGKPRWCINCGLLGVITVRRVLAVALVWEKCRRSCLRAIVFVLFSFVVFVVVILSVVCVNVVVVAVLFNVLLLFPEGWWVECWDGEETRIARGMVVSSNVHGRVGLVNGTHWGGGENRGTVNVLVFNVSAMRNSTILGTGFRHVMKGEGDGKGRTERSKGGEWWGERKRGSVF